MQLRFVRRIHGAPIIACHFVLAIVTPDYITSRIPDAATIG